MHSINNNDAATFNMPTSLQLILHSYSTFSYHLLPQTHAQMKYGGNDLDNKRTG